jgi:hypothetical protein
MRPHQIARHPVQFTVERALQLLRTALQPPAGKSRLTPGSR